MTVGPILPWDVLPGYYNDILFAERFENRASVLRKGGTVYGNPVISRGAVLDGTNDYFLYNLNGQFASSNEWSSFLVFRPDTAHDADDERRLYTTTGGGYYLFKRNDASSNVLAFGIGGTAIASVTAATYGSEWKVGERCVLTIAGADGDTDAWLNDTQIVTADSTAWSPSSEAVLGIGSSATGGNRFDGTIDLFMAINRKVTAEEHEAFVNTVGLLP